MLIVTPPPQPHHGHPQLKAVLTGGVVYIRVLPGRSHWVVVGVVLVHSGRAAAAGAATVAAMTPAARNSGREGLNADMVIKILEITQKKSVS